MFIQRLGVGDIRQIGVNTEGGQARHRIAARHNEKLGGSQTWIANQGFKKQNREVTRRSHLERYLGETQRKHCETTKVITGEKHGGLEVFTI